MEDFLNGLSPEKQQFIKDFMTAKKPGSRKKAIPFLMDYVAMAKNKHIVFSKEEIEYIYNLYSRDLSPMERQNIANILNRMKPRT